MMERLPRLSEASEESYDSSNSSRAPNFSRPRPQSGQQQLKHDRNQHSTTTHAVNAFHDPNRDMPDEPRFSLESGRTSTTASDNSVGSEVGWDGEAGELRSKGRGRNFDEQRATRAPRLGLSTSRSHTSGSTISASERPRLTPSSSYSNRFPQQIMKRVSVDQQSERLSVSTDQVEDTASHHTVSDVESDAGSFDEYGEWRSSDYDTSGLSDAKIRKLMRKGVNPALYAEMQAARKGKNKLVGTLVGNSFLG